MGYSEAAEMLLDKNSLLSVLLLLIALAVLLVLAAQAVKAGEELFGKKNTGSFEAHCKASEERFKAGERHIAENHAHIEDLQEGNRVICLSLLALLGHANRTSNGEEIEKAQNELTTYLINRK